MKSSWALFGCKVSLLPQHLSETMNTGSREGIMERKTEVWLSSAAVKHFSVIFHLHLVTLKPKEVSPTAFLARILSLPRLEDLVTTYLLSKP